MRRSSALPRVATRRPGIFERKLLAREDSPHQNHVLCEAEAGAQVDDHVVPNSESFFVLEGELEVFGAGFRETLRSGDFVHFEPGASHGVRALTAVKWLVVFAPAR